MHVEHAQLTAATGQVTFPSGTVVRGQFDASIRQLFPDWSDTLVTPEQMEILAFIRQLGEVGLDAIEILHIELAGSTSTFLHLGVELPDSSDVAGVLAQHDWVRPRFVPRANALHEQSQLHFVIEADRSTSSARAAWVVILRPLDSTTPALSDASATILSPIIFGTLGKLTAAGSEARESAPPPQSAKPPRAQPLPEAAPPPPPPQAIPAAPPAPRPPIAETGSPAFGLPDRSAIIAPSPVGAEAPDAAPPIRRTRGRSRSATRGTPPLPELRVTRLPGIDFPDVVTAGEKHDLVLSLAEIANDAATEDTFSVAIAEGKKDITLSVSVSAPGFLVEPREQPLTIGRTFNAAKERVTFSLTAQEPAAGEPVTRDIRADIWRGNESIGGVTHWATVRPKAFKGAVKGAGKSRVVPIDTTPRGRECELVIRVEGKDDHGSPPFQVSLRSRIPGEPEVESMRVGTISFTRAEFASFLNDQFKAFGETFPADGNAAALKQWRTDLLDEVDVLGKWLWTQLPDEFRDEYFRLYDAKHLPTSILVHSDEMLVPWELIVPHRQGKVLPRLGQAHVMGRWRPALGMRPRPQALTVTGATIANPKYQDAGFLVWSLLETADLTAALPAFAAMPRVDKAAMKALLGRKDVQLLHFTGHGAYAKHADLSTLILEGGDTITAMHFIGSTLLEQGHPIVYLNACEVGTSGVTMGQMGGFAAQCVEGGCSGIVAPYWAVADDSAREFAVAFYSHLKAGKAIGEALQDLRKSKPRDPTYQAFAYLGDPWTQARFA